MNHNVIASNDKLPISNTRLYDIKSRNVIHTRIHKSGKIFNRTFFYNRNAIDSAHDNHAEYETTNQ